MKDYRKCPDCVHGKVDPDELFSGARCSYCHNYVEVNIIFPVLISLSLCLISVVSFKYSFAILGLCSTLILVLYSSRYKRINAKYLPLKTYKDMN